MEFKRMLSSNRVVDREPLRKKDDNLDTSELIR